MSIRIASSALCGLITGLLFVSAQQATVNATTATLVWNPNPEPNIVGYKLSWGETNVTPSTIDVGGVTQWSFPNLVAGRTYRFNVTAYDTAGWEGPASGTLLYTHADAPAAPSQLVASAISQNEVALRWTDNSANETGFRLLRKVGPSGTYTTIQLPANTTTYTDFNVAPSTEYYYKVQAFNSIGNSATTQELRVITPANQPPISVTTSAEFIRADSVTKGFWRGVYGKDGGTSTPGYFYPPGYARMTGWRNHGLLWTQSTMDPRGVQKRVTDDHFAGAWFNTNAFELYLSFTNANIYQVSMYFVDFDRKGRDQLLEIFDHDTGKRLGMERISDFEEGKWSTWNLQGNLTLRFSRLAGPNAVLTAMLFDPPARGGASYVSEDTETSGSWIGSYGAQGGFASVSGQFNPPGYVQVTSQASSVTWAASTSDTRALQKSSGTDRFAAAWLGANQLTFDLRFSDSNTHQTSFYFLDYDRSGRQQLIEVLDLNSGARFEDAIISDFENGVYVSYNLRGNVRVRITRQTGPNAVLSAIFLDAPGPNHARFVGVDTETAGTWRGVYASNGQVIARESTYLPSFARVTISDALSGYWAFTTTDPRALQRPTVNDRAASTWYADMQFSVAIDLTDTAAHPVSFYCVDYNHVGRRQLVEIIDAHTGAVLDRTELTDFESGIWLNYVLSGNVIVRFTGLYGTPVLSGVFFD